MFVQFPSRMNTPVSMTTVQIYTESNLPNWVCDEIRFLTKPDGENRKLFSDFAHENDRSKLPRDSLYAIAYDDKDYELQPIGWVMRSVWDGIPCIQGFVSEKKRGQKVASALAALVMADHPREEIGVFSDEFASIARWLGYSVVRHYTRVEDGWIVKNGAKPE